MRREKFICNNNFVFNIDLQEIKKIVTEFDNEKNVDDINEVLELYNVKHSIENTNFLENISIKNQKTYIDFAKKIIPAKIGLFCFNIGENNIIHCVSNLDSIYEKDFWDMICKFKVYEKISNSTFVEILESKNWYIRHILCHKAIVQRFGSELRNKIKSSIKNVRLLCEVYLELDSKTKRKIYIPKELTLEDKLELVNQYIVCEDVEYNLLKLIEESQSTDDFKLDDMTIYLAKKKREKITKRLFSQSSQITTEMGLYFGNDILESSLEHTGLRLEAKYSLSWITENTDYPTLLNNFIFLFEYTDFKFRCNLVSKKIMQSIFEQFVGIRGRKEYQKGIVFENINSLALLQIIQYDNILKNLDISLLDVFKWFFEEYLLNEFNICNFNMNIPSENISYLEKCKGLAIEIEHILKQFSMFVTLGEINHELLQMSSKPTVIKNVPSMIKNKYIYPVRENTKHIFYWLFASGTSWLYKIQSNEKYDSLYSLIKCENIIADNELLNYEGIAMLIEYGYIEIDKNNYLKPSNPKMLIAYDLYYNEVSCSSYLSKYKNIIDDMIKDGFIEYGTSLFSCPEQNYFNYILNKSEYSNGLDLRNKYVHGTHPPATEEDSHMKNYYILMKLIAIIIIKINEEFCLICKDPTKNSHS